MFSARPVCVAGTYPELYVGLEDGTVYTKTETHTIHEKLRGIPITALHKGTALSVAFRDGTLVRYDDTTHQRLGGVCLGVLKEKIAGEDDYVTAIGETKDRVYAGTATGHVFALSKQPFEPTMDKRMMGTITKIISCKNVVYIGTENGCSFVDDDIHFIPEPNRRIIDFTVVNDILHIACDNNILAWNGRGYQENATLNHPIRQVLTARSEGGEALLAYCTDGSVNLVNDSLENIRTCSGKLFTC